jgi:membrane peptidoglycan carboxypeptidase
VANKGVIMTPHVMTDVLDSEGRDVEKYDPKQWLQPLSENAAAAMQADMYDVVARGTGTNAQIPGYAVGGKTGTAQLGTPGLLDTWFTAFAGQPGQVPTVAVAVVVLNVPDQGEEATGGAVAAPIAKAVLQKILAVQSTPATPGNAQPSGLPLAPQGNGQPAAGGGAGGNGFGLPGVVPTTVAPSNRAPIVVPATPVTGPPAGPTVPPSSAPPTSAAGPPGTG